MADRLSRVERTGMEEESTMVPIPNTGAERKTSLRGKPAKGSGSRTKMGA